MEYSNYVKVLSEEGFKVIHSHIDEGKNFFFYEPECEYDIIISNPPFSQKDNVLKRLYELNKPMQCYCLCQHYKDKLVFLI